MKESRGPVSEFLATTRGKILALAAGLAVAGVAIEHETRPVAARTVEAARSEPLSPHEARMEALKRSDTGRTIETPEQIAARFAVIDPLINLAYYKDNSKTMIIQIDRYLGVLLFDPLTEKDAEYARMSLEEVGECLRPIIERGKKKEADEARRILKGRLHEELIETIRRMDSDEVVDSRVFLGLTVQGPRSASFDDIRGAWKDKMTRKSTTSEKVRTFAPVVREQLKDKEGSLTFASWIDRQQEAIDLFAAHAEELGYSPDLIKLITPEAMLGVIHAEIFPDLDAETFVRLAPVLFETYNVAFAPAMGDKRFSGGLAQMTAETFEGILKKHRVALEKIRDTDTGATFTVPTAGNRKEFASSMLTDANSQFFYNVFVLAENTRLATRGVSKDKRFVAAWKKASEDERALYMGALISMANNLPSAAKHSAETSLDEHPRSIAEMARSLSGNTTVDTAARNGRVGGATAEYLVEMGKK